MGVGAWCLVDRDRRLVVAVLLVDADIVLVEPRLVALVGDRRVVVREVGQSPGVVLTDANKARRRLGRKVC